MPNELTKEQIAEKLAMQWYGEEAYEWGVKGLTRLILTAIDEATQHDPDKPDMTEGAESRSAREEMAVELLGKAKNLLHRAYDVRLIRRINTFLKAEGADEESETDHVD